MKTSKFINLKSFLIFLIFSILIISLPKNAKKNIIYIKLAETKFLIFNEFNNLFLNSKKCKIDILDNIPEGVDIIIGHQYGSNSDDSKHSLLLPKVEKFINANKEKINVLIFTGDVFRYPTISKWNNLYKEYSEFFDIYIAPGNHDIGVNPNSPEKKIFEESVMNLDKYPIKVDNKSNSYIFVNNVYKNLNRNFIDSEIVNSNTIFFMHEIPIKELRFFSNDYLLTSKKLSAKEYQNFKNKSLIFISGDSGKYVNRKSIGCFIFNKNKFIVNGIGNRSSDRLLLIFKNKIYQYKL